jgi:hypothetical protein
MFQEGSAFAFGAICDASCPYGASLTVLDRIYG